MLHSRRLPAAVAANLGLVYAAKLKLLDWLLRTPPNALDNVDVLVQHFGQSLGEWVWARVRRPETRTSFGDAVVALAGRARTDAAHAVLVADAIAHDAAFHTQWGVVGYELQFPRLYPDWLEPVKNVAVPFYEWLAGTGFEAAPFALTDGVLNRATVMKAFRPQSHGICGYCDGPLGDVGSELEANDCDHFFPKSQWPHLAIHPANLFAACKGCNSTWKGAKVPMGDADVAGLNGSYHPMLRPGAPAIVVSAGPSTISTRQLKISITDPVVPRRAETLTETLDLESRWTNSVNEKLDQGVSVLVAKTAYDKGHGWQADEVSVREMIEDDIAWRTDRVGKEERAIRDVAALEYMKRELLREIVADFAP